MATPVRLQYQTCVVQFNFLQSWTACSEVQYVGGWPPAKFGAPKNKLYAYMQKAHKKIAAKPNNILLGFGIGLEQ
jgi:hypothetical protein